jgi:hypothetical protein
MGATGFSIGLAKIKKRKRYGTQAEVNEEVVGIVGATFRSLVSTKRTRQIVSGWIDQGEESLLSLVGPGDELERPATKISFWFYQSVSWPQALAAHWLRLALVTKRTSLQQGLRYNHGYTLRDAGYPTAKSAGGGFFTIAGKIGHADADGVFWQLPEYDFQTDDQLTRPARALAVAAREGAPCGCPFCEHLRRVKR